MDHFTKVNIDMEEKMDMENLNSVQEICLRDSGKMVDSMEEEYYMIKIKKN